MATVNKNILIIEDDTNTHDLYKSTLEGEGYEVTTAVNGEEGLNRAQDGGFALILLDVMLPKMDGLAILAALKKEPPKKANGPIILLTNLSHDPIINEAKGLGAKDHLIKSDINPGQLVEEIKKHLA